MLSLNQEVSKKLNINNKLNITVVVQRNITSQNPKVFDIKSTSDI